MTGKMILGMLGAAALAGLPAARAARKNPSTFKGRPPGGIPVTYDFVATRPDYDTMRVTFRSARRSAGPVFVTGRNRKGSLTVKFPKAGALSVFSGDARLVEVMGEVETQGTFTAVATHYSADRTGAAGYVCGDWVRRDDQPAVRLDVASVTNWRGYEAPKEKGKAAKPRHTFTYRVTRLPDIRVRLRGVLDNAMRRIGALSEFEAIAAGLRSLRPLSPRKIESEAVDQPR